VVVVAAVAVPVDVAELCVAEEEPEEEEELLSSSSLSTFAMRTPPETSLGAEPDFPLEALW
jgi:hypothetical protein